MGKQSERRVGALTVADRRRGKGGKAGDKEHKTESSNSSANKGRKLFTIFFVVSASISVIVYLTGYSSPTETITSNSHQPKTDWSYQEVLTENSKVSENTSHRHFTNPVLGYITPWNSGGYEHAKRFNSKFTHLSPVWYDLKSRGAKFILEGRHNADKGWIAELRTKGNAKLLPRVVLEAFPSELLKKKKQRNKAVDLIVTECKEMEYDGIVLESWSRWAAYGILHDPGMRILALQFIKQLGQALHAVSMTGNSGHHLELVYVIGPPSSEKLHDHDFGPQDLRSLIDDVDGFSLMTYDFSSPQHPGPNAPLEWIRSTMQLLLDSTSKGDRTMAHKIFVGLNFYGNDFVLSEGAGAGGGAIMGRDYLSLLEKHRPELRWEKTSAEHFFMYTDDDWRAKHVVFYPSPTSVSMRLQEARSWGGGISIWEIGQGLDYFFDLL